VGKKGWTVIVAAFLCMDRMFFSAFLFDEGNCSWNDVLPKAGFADKVI
jgi:hypothetical protein